MLTNGDISVFAVIGFVGFVLWVLLGALTNALKQSRGKEPKENGGMVGGIVGGIVTSIVMDKISNAASSRRRNQNDAAGGRSVVDDLNSSNRWNRRG